MAAEHTRQHRAHHIFGSAAAVAGAGLSGADSPRGWGKTGTGTALIPLEIRQFHRFGQISIFSFWVMRPPHAAVSEQVVSSSRLVTME